MASASDKATLRSMIIDLVSPSQLYVIVTTQGGGIILEAGLVQIAMNPPPPLKFNIY